MAITINIGGSDKSSEIDWESLSVEQQLTSQVDSCYFNLKVHAGKTYRPAVGDAVLVYDGAVSIFGGTITRIDDMVEAGLLTRLTVRCVSHEHTLDRYLVSHEFATKTPRYILNAILDDFVNQPGKEIDLMEATESWTTEDGAAAGDTTQGEYIEGNRSLKLTATASNTATVRRETTLDLTTFSDGSASVVGDYIKVYFYLPSSTDYNNLSKIRIRFGSDAAAVYTNYFEYEFNNTALTPGIYADLTSGWFEKLIAKSAFTSVGAPDWSDIKKRQYRITAKASGTSNVVIDDARLISNTRAFFGGGISPDADERYFDLKFNYEQASQAIKQMAEACGCDWYIDPTRELYFFAPETIPAPYSLIDSSANFLWNSLRFNSDSSTIKNTIIVRGGEYQGSSTTYSVVADGAIKAIRSPYRLKNVTVTLGGAAQTVGIDNIDDPASYNCLYNYQEKTLKFTVTPGAGVTVAITGNPMIPVIIKRSDSTSVAANGTYEFLIIDKTIVTQQGARDRAAAELASYRDALVEGTFTATASGLWVGQTINVDITARGISGTYLIKTLTFRTKSPTEFIYDVQVVSTRSYGIIEYLLGLLRDQKKQVTISDDEVIDLVQDMDETLTITEAWTEMTTNTQTETVDMADAEEDALDHGTIFVLGPYLKVGFADPKRVFILSGSLLA